MSRRTSEERSVSPEVQPGVCTSTRGRSLGNMTDREKVLKRGRCIDVKKSNETNEKNKFFDGIVFHGGTRK